MTDLSPTAFDEASAPVVVAEEHLAFLTMVANLLSDGWDHPEVWPVLRDIGEQGEATGLMATIADLRDLQTEPQVRKALNLMHATLNAIAVDRVAGLAALKQLEAEHGLCPQVAGACFYVERLDDPRGADLTGRFCEAPFEKFETLVDGTVAPCCSIWTNLRLGKMDGSSLEDIWNSPDAQAMRASIHDGSFRHCNKQRCTRILDDSLPHTDRISEPHLRPIIDAAQTHLSIKPRWLFLAHDATCNLACPSCRAGLEIASAEQEQRFDRILTQVFLPLLDSGDHVKVSLSGQGDPWSSHHYRSILRHMADHDLSADLALHTNALLMGEKRWAEFSGLARYHPKVAVSVDACTPWVYEHVRRPGKWDRLVPNLQFIADRRADGTFSHFEINATIQLDNFHEMPAIVDWAGAIPCDRVRFYMMQNTGPHLAQTFDRKNVGHPRHPLHLAFLATLRDPRLDRPFVQLYDVSTWRDIALATTLPIDALDQDFTRETLIEAIRAQVEQECYPAAAALCASGRIRFADDANLLRIEGAVLDALGFARQAEYRRHMSDAIDTGLLLTNTATGPH